MADIEQEEPLVEEPVKQEMPIDESEQIDDEEDFGDEDGEVVNDHLEWLQELINSLGGVENF